MATYVPMGSFFGDKMCNLIGLYTLSMLESVYDIYKIGLYKDDGLAVTK